MSKKLTASDVPIGATAPELRHVLTRTDLVRYAGQTATAAD